MAVSVDHREALKILEKAYSEASIANFQSSSNLKDQIRDVIQGGHLTYRYILITGLIAKATNEKVNALALQAGANIKGAYDARSLCHSVFVPFERKFLQKRLGGSNEPYLNKPARFPTLSISNPVRRGRDRQLLEISIQILSNAINSSWSYEALKDAIYFTLQRPPRDVSLLIDNTTSVQSSEHIMRFVRHFISKSCEGESAVLIAGAAFSMLNETLNHSLSIKVHPVNQSGASSKEVSDIDVYREDCPFSFNEVKDKSFTKEDVEHAISKVVKIDYNSLIFLLGPRGNLRGAAPDSIIQYWEKKGFDLIFYELENFVLAMLAINQQRSLDKFLRYVNIHSKAARVKDDTIAHIAESIKKARVD